MFGILNGKLEHGSIEQFYKNVDTVGADANFKARVDVVTVEETLAVVRVLEEGWGGSIDFTDYLLTTKIQIPSKNSLPRLAFFSDEQVLSSETRGARAVNPRAPLFMLL